MGGTRRCTYACMESIDVLFCLTRWPAADGAVLVNCSPDWQDSSTSAEKSTSCFSFSAKMTLMGCVLVGAHLKILDREDQRKELREENVRMIEYMHA